MRKSTLGYVLAAGCLLGAAGDVAAESPLDIQRALETQARRAGPGFAGFSATRGEQFFNARHGREWTCATCHTADPRGPGTHATTAKVIGPLAPSANPERFTAAAKVEKWFRRNCNDVLGRSCTPVEKGDVLTWLLSLGR